MVSNPLSSHSRVMLLLIPSPSYSCPTFTILPSLLLFQFLPLLLFYTPGSRWKELFLLLSFKLNPLYSTHVLNHIYHHFILLSKCKMSLTIKKPCLHRQYVSSSPGPSFLLPFSRRVFLCLSITMTPTACSCIMILLSFQAKQRLALFT